MTKANYSHHILHQITNSNAVQRILRVLKHKTDLQTTKRIQLRQERHCDVRVISTDEARIQCESRDGSYVPNGKTCLLIPITLDRKLWTRCEFGVWVSIDAPGRPNTFRNAHASIRHLFFNNELYSVYTTTVFRKWEKNTFLSS